MFIGERGKICLKMKCRKLHKISVHAEKRGQQRGIRKEVMEFIMSYADNEKRAQGGRVAKNNHPEKSGHDG